MASCLSEISSHDLPYDHVRDGSYDCYADGLCDAVPVGSTQCPNLGDNSRAEETSETDGGDEGKDWECYMVSRGSVCCKNIRCFF